MADYVNVPTITDPDALAQDSFSYLEGFVPNWVPRDGQLDTWILSAGARLIATLLDTMTDVQKNIFRYYGSSVFGIMPIEASAAVAKTTWTLIDTAGHTIKAGTAVAVPNAGGELQPFEVTEEVVVAPGQSKTAVGGVTIRAIEPGKEGSELSAKGNVITLLDQYAWVKEIIIEEPTRGGVDAETDDAYLTRLIGELRLMKASPILTQDYAELARTVPGVYRAVAVNGYDPVAKTYNNERMVAVAVVDENGKECSATIKEAVKKKLEEMAIVNTIINMLAVGVTKVGVECEVKIWPEWQAADVEKRVNEALTAFLSPKEWGKPPFGDSTTWYQREKVTVYDVMGVIAAVPGVKDVLMVKLKKDAGIYEAVDITLTGTPAQMPEAGVMITKVV